jgi:hypothetical protein
MAMKALALKALFAACALLVGGSVSAKASSYLVTIEQVGSNVVATGGGQIDLHGLSFFAGAINFAAIQPSFGIIAFTPANPADAYTGIIVGPSNFGLGNVTPATTSSGPSVGFVAPVFSTLTVPLGYVSDTLLATSMDVFDNATLASLGATPGTYLWTWGTGADQNFTIEVVATTPLPTTLPLFAGGLGVLGLLGWRRKRKAASAV